MPAEDIATFVEWVAEAAGDGEVADRVNAAKSAVERLADGENTPGLPRMREVWGEELADTFALWIGYEMAGQDDAGGARADASQTDTLIALASDAELFHSPEGIAYADVPAKGHRETWPVGVRGNSGFALWLRHKYYKATGGAPNSQALTAALNTLAAKARYDGPCHEVYVRIAAVGGRVYLDLADEDWKVIEIDAQGWRVVSDPPVRFLRRRGMLSLPMPVEHADNEARIGAMTALYNYMNVATDEDRCLLVSFLLAALSGRGPYAVLLLMGEPGSAKSTLTRFVKELIDPNKAPLRSVPREARDMFVAANNSYLIAFDNFSTLPDWLSDMLCRLSTGGGFGTRQLYTDEDEMLFDAMRPIALTCVDNVIVRGDLSDRAIFLTLLPIPENKRRHERTLWEAFERDRPAILGALLDIVSRGLRELPHVKLDEYPRMADFAEWATACEQGASDILWDKGMFADAYALNRANAAQSVVEEDLVANAIVRLMERRENVWKGSASALLSDLNEIVGDTIKQHKRWPKAPNALSARMNKAAGVLRKVGIEIEETKRSSSSNCRVWRITLKEDGKGS